MAADAEPPSADEAPLPAHKPAFLRRVQIRNYKSIAFCDVALEPLTLFVGRNGSGKSNFLDALGFLADLMEMRVSEAVAARGGWRATIAKNAEYSAVEFRLEVVFPGVRSNWIANYSFSLQSEGSGKFVIGNEQFTAVDASGGRRTGFKQSQGKLTWIGEGAAEIPKAGEMFIDPQFRPRYGNGERLFLTTIGTPPFLDVAERLGKSRIYDFVPSAMRPHQPFQAHTILNRDGGNLAYAIKVLEESDDTALERVGQYLQSIVPEVADFRIQEYGDQETIRFRLSTDGQGRMREFDAWSMSDGTLRALATLIAARQLTYPLEQCFVGIEEPETSLHPKALHALVDALDEATLGKQILLTTHSSEMLDNPTIQPENVRVVRMIDGQTVIAEIDQASREIARRGTNTLGGLLRDNQLEPDRTDLDRQQRLAAEAGWQRI